MIYQSISVNNKNSTQTTSIGCQVSENYKKSQLPNPKIPIVTSISAEPTTEQVSTNNSVLHWKKQMMSYFPKIDKYQKGKKGTEFCITD